MNAEFKNRSRITHHALALLFSAFCLLPSAFGEDLAALTDTNGAFTWPPTLPHWQFTDYTNHDFKIWNTNNGARVVLGADGHFKFTDAAGLVILSSNRTFTLTDSNGVGFGYTNGVFYINSEIYFYQTSSGVTNPGSPTWQSVQITNLTTAINNLSNQMFALFSASNSVTLAALASTNTLIRNALNATNTILLAGIATNGVNGTNFGYLIGYNATNYANGLAISATNFAYLMGANATNYANLVAVAGTNNANLFAQWATNYANYVATNGGSASNYIASHFRFGTVSFDNTSNYVVTTFSPSFNDPDFYVYASPRLVSGGRTNAVSWAGATTYNSFQMYLNYPSATGSTFVDYLLYHP